MRIITCFRDRTRSSTFFTIVLDQDKFPPNMASALVSDDLLKALTGGSTVFWAFVNWGSSVRPTGGSIFPWCLENFSFSYSIPFNKFRCFLKCFLKEKRHPLFPQINLTNIHYSLEINYPVLVLQNPWKVHN